MKKVTVVLSLFVFLMAGLTYWTWKQLDIGQRGPSLLRLSLDNAVESLDPATAYSDDSLVVSAQVLEPLYQYHYLKRPYEIQPLIAEATPQLLDKGRILIIKLKKGVFFHDHPAFKGKQRELTAHDFVIQFKRLALHNLKSPGRSLFSGLVEGFDQYNERVGGDWKKLTDTPLPGVLAQDNHTLQIRLKKSEPPDFLKSAPRSLLV